MITAFVDLHIHIGRSPSGKPVKITGSKNLTIENILEEASERKGLDMIGVIDSQVPEVLDRLAEMVQSGEAQELVGGGVRYKNVTLILGSEIELYDPDGKGPVHVLAFMPDIESMKAFSLYLSKHITNIRLSTQRFSGTARSLQKKVKEMEGLFIPAHIFTPFKSLLGSGVKRSLTEILDPELIDAVELGLSSDTSMAMQVPELAFYPFVTNSDAHSLGKLGREYQEMVLDAPTFEDLRATLHREGSGQIVANYGLDPRLGKYHRTSCAGCFQVITGHDKGKSCPYCGERRIIKGVYERLEELKGMHLSDVRMNALHQTIDPNERPPYIHQVPLDFIPSVGPKTLEKLLNHFGTEMAILHHVKEKDLASVVGKKTAELIIKARTGTLSLETGGAGRYGKVTK